MMRDLPPIVVLLRDLWGVDADLMRRFWGAVMRARWSEVRAWMTELLMYQTMGDGMTMSRTVCHPPRLMHICEKLVQEKQFARRGASQIQDKILLLLDAEGAWQ